MSKPAHRLIAETPLNTLGFGVVCRQMAHPGYQTFATHIKNERGDLFAGQYFTTEADALKSYGMRKESEEARVTSAKERVVKADAQ